MAQNKRKAIPWKIKLHVVLRQRARCACGCGAYLEKIEDAEYDHRPPLALRERDEATGDTIPPSNDPDGLFAMARLCHRLKTSGRPHVSAGSDIHVIAKAKRLTRDHEDFRRKMLTRQTGDEVPDAGKKPKRKAIIPSRPFPKRAAKMKRSKK